VANAAIYESTSLPHRAPVSYDTWRGPTVRYVATAPVPARRAANPGRHRAGGHPVPPLPPHTNDGPSVGVRPLRAAAPASAAAQASAAAPPTVDAAVVGDLVPANPLGQGWTVFAAIVLGIVGCFHVLEGVAGVTQHALAFVDPARLVLVDLGEWGALTLISGAILLLAALSLLSMTRTARVAAAGAVVFDALTQALALGAYPMWTLLAVTLDIVLLYALTVRGSHRSTVVVPEAQFSDAQFSDAELGDAELGDAELRDAELAAALLDEIDGEVAEAEPVAEVAPLAGVVPVRTVAQAVPRSSSLDGVLTAVRYEAIPEGEVIRLG
jgi:hypothetical protein